MARSGSREDVQDRILGQMDRSNRQNESSRNGVVKSLSQQLDEEAAWNRQSPEDKLRNLSYGDWQRKVKSYVDEKRMTITDKAFNAASMRHKAKYTKFHQDGAPLSEVVEWLQQIDRNLLNG